MASTFEVRALLSPKQFFCKLFFIIIIANDAILYGNGTILNL